jgi:pilus assembly protein CpaE
MSAHGTVNILIVDDNERARAKLIDQLRYSDIRIVGESPFGAAAASWAGRLAVDVVIVVVEEPVVRGLRTIDLLTTGAESWPVVAVSSANDREAMRKAMLAGARDYVGLPAAEDELRASVMRVHQREQERREGVASGEGNAHGTIVTVMGVKGGIGKTVTAVNLAAAIAQSSKNHVALVDADIQFGDCAVLLDVVPERSIVDAAAEVDPATPHLIEPYLTDCPGHLSLLAAPMKPGDADALSPEVVGNVLRSLGATRDVVVVDTSPRIDAVTALAIDLSSIVLVVVTPEVPCVRRTRAALDLLQDAGYSRDKIKVLLNRASRRGEVPNADLESALDVPIYAEIPDDRAVAHSVTVGVPLITGEPRAAATRAYLDLGRRLAGVSEHQSRRRWFWRRNAESPAAAVPAPPNPLESDALIAAWAPAVRTASAGELTPADGLDQVLAHSWRNAAAPDGIQGAHHG